jgi:prophage antirepressor-like protein
MSSLIPFSFESKSIRVLDVVGNPWFVAKDVMQALDYADASTSNVPAKIAHVPEEWKGRHPMATPGGEQEVWCLSEPGLYFFVNRSDKPKALPFQKWVAGEVLPAIRQTGGYGVHPMHTPAPRPMPETVTLTKDEYIDLLKAQIALHEAQPRRRVLEDAEKTEILALRDQGWTPAAIGRKVGRPAGSINTFLRRVRLGLEE